MRPTRSSRGCTRRGPSASARRLPRGRAGAGSARPVAIAEAPWSLPPDLDLPLDRLHGLLWANNYDAREGEPVWWWGEKAKRLGATDLANAGERRRRDPSRRPRRLDRRRPALEHPRAAAADRRERRDRRGPDRAGPRRLAGLGGRARAGPARGRLPPRRPGPGDRAGGLRQDPRADRADAPPARRSRLPQRVGHRRRLQPARPGGDAGAARGADAPDEDAQLAGLLAPGAPPPDPPAGDERLRRPPRHRGGLPDPAAAPHQHRPRRALPRRADARPARAHRSRRGRGVARRRSRPRRRLRQLPRPARPSAARSTSTSRSTAPSRRCFATASSAAGSRPSTATCSSTSSRT